MSIQRFWILTGRKLSGEATAEELKEWEELSVIHLKDQSTGQFMQLMARNWGTDASETPDAETASRMTARLAAKMQKSLPVEEAPATVPIKKVVYTKWIRLAAAVLLLITAGFCYEVFFSPKTTERSPRNEIVASRGNKSHIILSDGTSVWLNADSKLSYNNNFGKKNRTVKLVGEAYFDVAKKAETPFIIELRANVKVVVLGTSFNLRAYEQDDKVETTLISGALEVQYALGEATQKVLLEPMQKLSLQHPIPIDTTIKGMPTTIVQMSPVKYYNNDEKIIREVVWKDNQLCFDAATFDQVALQLERWFNIHIVFKDESLKQKRFTAYIKGEKLPEVMAAMAKAAGYFTYQLDRNTRILTIDRKK
ncbi:FecR family protein [Chitinophaga sp.]|uniref:FecR family protein n=1 Tax=Chitinophaga sp. TaxID=1869181 RepID=UPI002F937FE5